MTDKKKSRQTTAPLAAGYDSMLSGLSGLLEQARHVSARAAARGATVKDGSWKSECVGLLFVPS